MTAQYSEGNRADQMFMVVGELNANGVADGIDYALGPLAGGVPRRNSRYIGNDPVT